MQQSVPSLRSPSEHPDGGKPEVCVLVGAEFRDTSAEGAANGYTAEESLEELHELAESAGAAVAGSVIQSRARPEPATLIGKGKVEEIKNWAAEVQADFVLFDQNLTPTQQRNLERLLEKRVLDRTQLILDIFARHARTREGKLQVELAQLTYMLPRLAGQGVQMSRLGGGIGTRGPGETQLETDRRRIGVRIDKLKQDLKKVRSTRELQRKKRTAIPLSTVALAGYTNAGKSTLFNALTAAHVKAEQQMFATLDPTIRVLELPSRRRILLSDTVGFIRNLPTTLVEAFRATLEEVTEAAMVLHVVDLSSPHRNEQIAEVDRILGELGAGDKRQVLVLNKKDLADPLEAAAALEALRAAGGRYAAVAISAKTGEGLNELSRAIEEAAPSDPITRFRARFTHSEGARLNFLYRNGRVVERNDEEHGVEVLAEAPRSVAGLLRDYLVTELPESDEETAE